MMLLFKILLSLLVLFLVAVLLVGFLRTWQISSMPYQQTFLKGSVPNPEPEGFYAGTTAFSTPWIGKKFDAASGMGVNIIKNSAGEQIEKYPFKTYFSNGLIDRDLQVLKIDYNIPENPFWVRWILDEIVQTAPGQYFGKMHLRLIPGFPFSILYFQLNK